MLTIYRRHLKSCSHRSEGRAYRRCRCPLWVDGFLGKEEIRESLRLRDWEKGQQRIREWEAEGARGQATEGPISIDRACAEFLQDAEARKLEEATLYKYRVLFEGPKPRKISKPGAKVKPLSPGLKQFAADQGIRYLI